MCRDHVWWPGLSKEIQTRVETCKECQVTKRSQGKEPLITTPLPRRPWEKIAEDICKLDKKKGIVVIDYFFLYLEFRETVQGG